MNIFNREQDRSKDSKSKYGLGTHDRRTRLLMILLLILAGTVMFLATPFSEKHLGIKLSSLFSSADEERIAFDCVAEPCEPVDTQPPTGGGGVLNCLRSPCPSDLSILNPKQGDTWNPGKTYKISWDGFDGSEVDLELIPYDCDTTRPCYPSEIIAQDQKNRGTIEWTVPKDIHENFYNGLSKLQLTIDNSYQAQTSVQISKSGNVDEYPDGTFIRLLSNPNMIFRLEDGTKRQLPYPAEEVIRCLGLDPSSIKNGLAIHERIPIANPLFCNPVGIGPSRHGALISGLPDSDVTSVYLVEKGVRRPFPSGKIFECLGYNWNDIHIANSKDVQLPIGPAMSCSDVTQRLQLLGDGSLPDGLVNVLYNAKVSAVGGVKPYTFSITKVEPSNKVEIDNNGQISGTFRTAGVYQITVKVTDRSNDTQPDPQAKMTNSVSKVYSVHIKSTGTGGGGGTGGGDTTGENCQVGPVSKLVALYRFYNATDSDHYYSTSASAPRGYRAEGITSYIYSVQAPATVPMYQSYNSVRKDHYYTTDRDSAETYGYKLDGVVGYVYPTQVTGSTSMYRMYNDAGKHYLMTSSTVERDAILNIGFVQQGNIGYACGVPRPGSEIIPIYRLWSSAITDHFFTTDIEERDLALQRGYVSEGIAGNILSVPGANRIPIYRLFSAKYGNHFYTTSETEANSSGYSKEGVMGYIYTIPSSNVTQWYRLYNGKIGDHFYTTSSSERDSAVNGGYRFEGTMGYLP